MQASTTYSVVISKLKAYRGRVKKFSLLQGGTLFTAFVLILILLVCAIEAIFAFPSLGRLTLDLTFLTIIVVGFAILVGRPIVNWTFRPNAPTLVDTALDIGKLYGGVNDKLANGIQVYEKQKNNPEKYSIELIEESLLRAAAPLTEEDFVRKVNTKKVNLAARKLFASLSIFVVLWLLFPTAFSQASKRLFYPSKEFINKPQLTIRVSPGNVSILKGEDVEVFVNIVGKSVDEILLHIIRVNLHDDEVKILQPSASDTFRFTIQAVKDSINYYVQAENVKSSLYTISVTELPMLRNLQLKLIPPSYSGIAPHFLEENVGDVVALKGTEVRFTGNANKPLQSASLFLNDSEHPLEIIGKQLRGLFRIKHDASYHFKLKDHKGNINPNPIEYRLTAIPDTPPLVKISVPGKDVDIGEDMLLPLVVEAEDDYGFSQLRFGYQIYESGAAIQDSSEIHYMPLKGFSSTDQQVRIEYTWDLSDLDLLPEDFVIYFAEVFDNDVISGPKSSQSRRFRVRFPSIYEMYEEMAETQESAFESLEEVYDRSLELKERLDNLAQEMKKDPQLTWEEQKELEDVIKKQGGNARSSRRA